MNKDEIKKALVLCQMSAVSTCRDCPYTENCDGTQLYKDALNLITEQEQEIAELKAAKNDWKQRYESLDQRYMALVASSVECVDKKVKKAKTDVLNELKEKIVERMGDREYMGVKYKQGVFSESEIDEMIAEVQNAEDKS